MSCHVMCRVLYCVVLYSNVPGVSVTVAPPAATTAPFFGALVSPPATAPPANVHRPLGKGKERDGWGERDMRMG